MFKKETTDRNYHEDPFRAVNFKIDGDGKMWCSNGKGFHLQYRKAIKRKRVWTGRGNLSVRRLQWMSLRRKM